MKKRIIRHTIVILMCVLAFFIQGCSQSAGDPSAEGQTEGLEPSVTTPKHRKPGSDMVTIYVNGMPIEIDVNKDIKSFNCPTLNTEFDTEITTEDKNHKILVNGQELKDGICTVKLDTLDALSPLELQIDEENFMLRTIPDDFPQMVSQGQGEKEGYYYTTLGGYVLKLDTSGGVVFYKKDLAFCAGPFRRNIIDDEVIYSYLRFSPSKEHTALKDVGCGQTSLVLMDEHYREIGVVPYMIQTEKIPENFPPENHDHLVLGKDHYVLATYLGKKVTNIPEDVPGHEFGANVAACIFQEIKDGTCVFEWDSTDHPELYGASVEAGDFGNTTSIWSDYAHINAIFIDPRDDNFIVSMRNLDNIMKIDRKSGEILWILGGKLDQFGLTDDQKFHRQHNVSVTEDGSLLLFDNGCLFGIAAYPPISPEEKAQLDPQQVSRVLKIKLDEENKTIQKYEAFQVEHFFSNAMGSAQVINDASDTMLICWGQKIRAGMPLFQEVNFQDQRVNFELFGYGEKDMCYRVTYYEK